MAEKVVGAKYKVIEGGNFSLGDIITLIEDDGSSSPLFEDERGNTHFKCMDYVELIPEKLSTHPSHYSQFKIEPLTFVSENNLGFFEGNIIKYVCRYKQKNGVEDLEKAKYYLEKLIEKEQG